MVAASAEHLLLIICLLVECPAALEGSCFGAGGDRTDARRSTFSRQKLWKHMHVHTKGSPLYLHLCVCVCGRAACLLFCRPDQSRHGCRAEVSEVKLKSRRLRGAEGRGGGVGGGEVITVKLRGTAIKAHRERTPLAIHQSVPTARLSLIKL